MHNSGRGTVVDKVFKRFKQEREPNVVILTHPTNRAVAFQAQVRMGMHHNQTRARETKKSDLNSGAGDVLKRQHVRSSTEAISNQNLQRVVQRVHTPFTWHAPENTPTPCLVHAGLDQS